MRCRGTIKSKTEQIVLSDVIMYRKMSPSVEDKTPKHTRFMTDFCVKP